MTSEEMYRHLNHIQGLVPPESRNRFLIETIVFRASAILQGNRRLALKLEDGVLPLEVPLLRRSGTRKLSGPTGYSVGVTANVEEGSASKFRLDHPTQASVVRNTHQLQPSEEPVELFIAKAKYQEIPRYFPHTIAKMYAMVTQHKFVFSFVGVRFSQDVSRKMVIRGVISDGYQWVFIILCLDESGKGGFYWVTSEVLIDDHLGRIENPEPDAVAGILAYWVCRHFFFSARRVHKRVAGAALF